MHLFIIKINENAENYENSATRYVHATIMMLGTYIYMIMKDQGLQQLEARTDSLDLDSISIAMIQIYTDISS